MYYIIVIILSIIFVYNNIIRVISKFLIYRNSNKIFMKVIFVTIIFNGITNDRFIKHRSYMIYKKSNTKIKSFII